MEGACIFMVGVVVGSILTGMFFNWIHRDKLEELRTLKGQLSRKHFCN